MKNNRLQPFDPVQISEDPISWAQASKREMIPLSMPCRFKSQHWILLNMAQDMRDAGIEYAFVDEETLGISIWRTPPDLWLDSKGNWRPYSTTELKRLRDHYWAERCASDPDTDTE